MKIQLTKYQLFLLLFIMQTAFVYTSFQNIVIEHGKRSSSIQFIAVSVLFYFILLFYERAHKYFLLNKFTKILYLLYWYVYIITFVNFITYVLTTWVFINTPHIILIALFLLICFYASISRPETAINLGVVLIPMLILFLFFMFRAVPYLHVTNLLPLFSDMNPTWTLGFLYSAYAFGGAEVYLVLRKYLDKNEKMSTKILTLYVVFLSGFYLLSILFALMFFALEEIYFVPEPIFYLLHSLEVSFVKRLDLFFVYIWLSWCLVSIVNYVFVMRLYYFEKKRKKPKLQLFLYFTGIGAIASFLTSYSVLELLKEYLIYGIVIFSFVIPTIIILVNKFRGRSVSESSKSSS